MNDFAIEALARPEIRALQAYRPRRREQDVLLDSNESPWPPAGQPDGPGALNRYPFLPPELRQRVAACYGVAADRVLLTRGSDDGIDALLRTFCRAGTDSVIITPPTFGMYAISARIQAAELREIPLQEDFGFPVDQVCAALGDSVRLVFACSPNNPTGGVVPLADIRRLCEAARGSAIVVVDEAYAEFMQQPSACSLLPEFDNLVVLRTASKALALAGARFGVLLGAPQLVDFVQRVLPPYPLPTASIDMAMQAYSPAALALAAERSEELKARREELAASLAELPAVRRVQPSDANFLLVEITAAARLVAELADEGICLRSFDDPRLADCLRISIGTAAETARLLASLQRRTAG